MVGGCHRALTIYEYPKNETLHTSGWAPFTSMFGRDHRARISIYPESSEKPTRRQNKNNEQSRGWSDEQRALSEGPVPLLAASVGGRVQPPVEQPQIQLLVEVPADSSPREHLSLDLRRTQ